jgi:hypothetical protein
MNSGADTRWRLGNDVTERVQKVTFSFNLLKQAENSMSSIDSIRDIFPV